MKNVGAIQRELCRTTCNKIDLVLFCWRKNFREKNKALLFRKIARVYQVVATRCTLVSRMFTSSFLWQFTHLFVAGLLGVGVGTYWGKCWFWDNGGDHSKLWSTIQNCFYVRNLEISERNYYVFGDLSQRLKNFIPNLVRLLGMYCLKWRFPLCS